jgi:hypothetical protein
MRRDCRDYEVCVGEAYVDDVGGAVARGIVFELHRSSIVFQ